MPSDQRRYNYRSSRFRLPATSVAAIQVCPSTPKKLPRINGTTLSPKSDPSNSKAALRTPIASLSRHIGCIPDHIAHPSQHQPSICDGQWPSFVIRLPDVPIKHTSASRSGWHWPNLPLDAPCGIDFNSGPLALTIRFFFASALRRDLDGGLKIAQDAICEGLGLNDNRIIETHLYKQVDKADPRMEVSLSFLHPPHHSA